MSPRFQTQTSAAVIGHIWEVSWHLNSRPCTSFCAYFLATVAISARSAGLIAPHGLSKNVKIARTNGVSVRFRQYSRLGNQAGDMNCERTGKKKQQQQLGNSETAKSTRTGQATGQRHVHCFPTNWNACGVSIRKKKGKSEMGLTFTVQGTSDELQGEGGGGVRGRVRRDFVTDWNWFGKKNGHKLAALFVPTGGHGARAGRAVSAEVFPASPVYYARSHVAQSFRRQLQQHRWVKLHYICFLPILPLASARTSVSSRALAPARNSKLAASASSGFWSKFRPK